MDGIALLVTVVTFIMALVALNKISRLETALFKLREELQRISDGTQSLPVGPSAQAAEAAAPAEAPVETTERPATLPDGSPAPEAAHANWYQSGAGQPEAAIPDAVPASPSRDMEQALAGRWFVWIGGVAIAIGGLLFVKYAYDNGLISPVMQIVLGIAAGLVLILAGSLLRRGDETAGNYVPAALSAAGLAVLFAAIYAAYALYGIIAPQTAFLGLAAVGLCALVLSRWQGPFIAVLGLLGSYVTPTLIPSADPSAWNFFPYLLVILVASLMTMRGRRWWWLGHLAVLGTLVWSVLWLIGPFEVAETWVVGLSAIVMGLAAVVLPRGFSALREEGEDITPAQFLGFVGQVAATVILVLLVLRTEYVDTGLILLAIGLGVMVLLAWLSTGMALLAPFAGLVMLVVLGSWQEAAFHAMTLDENGVYSWSNSFGPEAQRFLRWMLWSGAAFTFMGAAGIILRPAKRAWGALGGGAGFLFVWAAWARADFLLPAQNWAVIASCFAAFLLLVTALWGRRQEGDGAGAGLLAAGAAALLVMALDRLLDGGWLTLGIAGLAFVYAILSTLLKPRMIGPITAAIATLATLRLFLARELWFDEKGLPWGDHWVLYAYGVPAVLFLLASRILGRSEHPRSSAALEGMSLGLVITLISLELRVLISGGITYEDPRFLEMAAHILAWAGAAYGLMHGQRLYSSVVSTWGARILLVASAVAVVMLSLFWLNPVLTGEPVPGSLFFNALLLAYLAPAILTMLIMRRLAVIGWENVKPLAAFLALILLFAYVTLQTKRYFQGMMMAPESLSLAETYAYSAVWLAFALVLFVVGIRLRSQPVRLAGLGVLALVVLKVFIGDMSNLEGLYRIASFVGLGLCLVGIGWLYQHFVKRTA
jgi:uncharacterized membrane protein